MATLLSPLSNGAKWIKWHLPQKRRQNLLKTKSSFGLTKPLLDSCEEIQFLFVSFVCVIFFLSFFLILGRGWAILGPDHHSHFLHVWKTPYNWNYRKDWHEPQSQSGEDWRRFSEAGAHFTKMIWRLKDKNWGLKRDGVRLPRQGGKRDAGTLKIIDTTCVLCFKSSPQCLFTCISWHLWWYSGFELCSAAD